MTVFVDQEKLSAAGQDLRLGVARSLEQVEAMADQWCALEGRCNTPMAYFQTFDWCSNWLREVASGLGNTEPHVIAVWQGEYLVAVVPLMVTRTSAGLSVLSALGDPHTQYAGLLLDAKACTAGATAMIRSYLAQPEGCDALYVDLLPSVSPLAEMLDPSWREAGYVNQSSSLDLTQFGSASEFLEDNDAKKRRKRMQRRQKIERQFGELKLRTVWGGEPEFATLVHRCVAMKKDWIAGTGRISTGFSIPGYAEFISKLDGNRETREGAVAFVKQAGDRIIAIEVSMIRDGHLYAYIGGFDWELGKFSPGKVQMEATVCWCIENGVKAYDLLGNVASYKDSWTNISCDLHAYSRAYTMTGWLYSTAWRSHMRPALKQLYQSLPTGLRQWASSSLAS
jgi:CelD/BcsL family acetyltransferase involved in cellulose biosynthesis